MSNVFHAYDIRGLSPQEIDGAFAKRLARALVRIEKPARMLVGRDMRMTSPELEGALIEELTQHGVDVVRIGLCTTPLFNVTLGMSKGGYDLGVMVTASHNPAEYNGFKLVRKDVLPIGFGNGMEELAQAFEKDEPSEAVKQGKGSVSDQPDAAERYVDYILSLAKLPSDMPNMNIAVDAGNGMGGAVLPELFRRLPWLKVTELYFEPDGTFPNHEANPIKPETLREVCATIVRERCDFGLALDGDADRVCIIDEQGTPLLGGVGTALLAKELLVASPNQAILYDVRSTWTIPETVEHLGGASHMTRIGQTYIKRDMREHDALFAGEASMHYFFRDLFNVESGEYILLLVAKMLARTKASLSSIWKPLHQYAHSGEINFTVQNPTVVFDRLREKYHAEASATLEMDGLRMDFRDPVHPENDWWFNVRSSNTEPLVRLNLEARTEEKMEIRKQELVKLIQDVAE